MATEGRLAGVGRFGRAARGRGQAGAQVEGLARNIANQIIRQREEAARRSRNGRTYSVFDPADDILPNNIETVTKGLFSGNTGSLQNFHTSSTATSTQNSYYRTIYDGNPALATSTPQFSIAYGSYGGSGSSDTTGNLNDDTPSRAIYKQYAQLLLDPLDKKFTFNGVDSDSIYVLNFNRARFKEKLDPGNLEINLAHLSGSTQANNSHTGSNVKVNGLGHVLKLIDDSSVTSGQVGENALVYNIVSGTIDDGTVIFTSTNPQYFGLMYPTYGVAILNGDTLDMSASFGTVSGSGVQGDNSMKVVKSLSGSTAITPPSGVNYGLQARSSEQVKATYYFVRVKNGDYNYSNNPSFVTGSLGQLAYSTFVTDPQIFVTTVGLYNDRRELLAVAKLSKPLLKSFTREALVKVKLDF